MSGINVTGKVNETFDNNELDVSYRAEFTSAGGVAVHVDVFWGSELLVEVPVAQFGPDEADGFSED